MFRNKVQRIHFVGIGGSGMSGIAEVLLTMGYQVTGSDLKRGAAVRRLQRLGGRVYSRHAASNVDGADVVVKSTAISGDNEEVRAAEALGLAVIPRAEMLAELMRMKYGIAVAGTHGKTTTTSMLATCLHHGGLDPTIVIGGRLDSMGSSARLGSGEFMVAEADESDGSFRLLHPTISVLTSIDPEHLDYWGSMEALVDGFATFAGEVPFYGFATLCLDHPNVQALIPRIRRRLVTYGMSAQAEVRGDQLTYEGLTTRFQVWWRDEELGSIALGLPGRHNVQNALAAIAVSLHLDLPFPVIQEALDGFSGVDRRFSIRAKLTIQEGQAPLYIVDDYGHHPAEIRATLRAARQVWPDGRIFAIFQPHRYSRVNDLLDDFARSFNAASEVVVCPMYAAGEDPIEGLDQHRVAARLLEHGHRTVHAVETLDDAVELLEETVGPGDIVLTLGAGNVNIVCMELEERIRARS
ncbi:MAG: UDP-N-acetylmuramate--L-alanine ligase [Myxococcota bacterium]|jgi:UDP-N-acetylmuramate--alanine ligase|nr:UDP-N-acetylmuramate--L-alanine ligase [Myxococcota bacterium]